jgi:hypothetical protein
MPPEADVNENDKNSDGIITLPAPLPPAPTYVQIPIVPPLSKRQTMQVQNNIFQKKYLIWYPDGRFVAIKKIDSSFNDTAYTFRLGPCDKTVVQKVVHPRDDALMMASKQIFKRHGFDDGNIHNVVRCASTYGQHGEDKQKDYNEMITFELPTSCKCEFLDLKCKASNDVYVDADNIGCKWLYIWVVDVNAKEESYPDAKIQLQNK